MKKTDKIKFISEKLDELFPNPPIPLDYSNAYTMLVAVVLSAQCTDIRVNQVTKVLFKKAKTPAAMVKLGIDAIAERIALDIDLRIGEIILAPGFCPFGVSLCYSPDRTSLRKGSFLQDRTEQRG